MAATLDQADTLVAALVDTLTVPQPLQIYTIIEIRGVISTFGGGVEAARGSKFGLAYIENLHYIFFF